MGNRPSSQNPRRLFRSQTVTTVGMIDPEVVSNSPPLQVTHPLERDEKELNLADDPGEIEHQNSASTTESTSSRVKPHPPSNTPPPPTHRKSYTGTTPELQPKILIRSPTDPHILLPVSSIDVTSLPEIIHKWSENVRDATPTSHDDTLDRNSGLQVLDDPGFSRSHSVQSDITNGRSRGTNRTIGKNISSPIPVPNIFAMDGDANDDDVDDELRQTRSLGHTPSRRRFSGGRMKARSASFGGGLMGPNLLRGRSASMWFPKLRGRSNTQGRKYPRFWESHNKLVDCPPQVYIHICSFLEVKFVCHMSSMCRYLYIIGNNKELWRQLVRRDMNGYIRRKRKQHEQSLETAPPAFNRNAYGAMTISGIHNSGSDPRVLLRTKSLPSLAWINRHDAYRVNKKKKSVKRKRKKTTSQDIDDSPMTRPTVEPKTPPPNAGYSVADPEPLPLDDSKTREESVEAQQPPPKRSFFKRIFSRRHQKTKWVAQASHTPPPPNGLRDSVEPTESQSQNSYDPTDPRSEGTLTSEKSVTLSDVKDSKGERPRHHHTLTVPNMTSATGGIAGHGRAYSYTDTQSEKHDENEEEILSQEFSQSDFDEDRDESEELMDNVYIAADDDPDEPIDQEDFELEQKISRTPLDSLDGEHPREVYRVLQEEINNKKRLKEARKQREHLINSLRMAGLY